MKHVDENRLALLAGGDGGLWPTLRARLHVRNCPRCQAELRAFHETRRSLSYAATEMPPGIDWAGLSEEMTGNIRVGLAAGECVGDYPAKRRFFRLQWNGATVAVVLSGIFVFGFWLNLPTPQAEHLISSLKRIVTRDSPHAAGRRLDGVRP